MPRRKHRPRTHCHDDSFASFRSSDSFDEIDAFTLSEMEDLLSELQARMSAEVAAASRGPIRALRRRSGRGALGDAWCSSVGDCGAGESRRQRGINYMVGGAVVGLGVHRGHITAVVRGSRRYHVRVDFTLPAATRTLSLRRRLEQTCVHRPPGPLRQAAVVDAIFAEALSLFPTSREMIPSCTCPDGPRCKHVVAAVYGFGTCLDGEPEFLLSLWGLDISPEPTLIPLAPGKQRPTGDLAALFGIDLLVPTPTGASSSPPLEPESPALTAATGPEPTATGAPPEVKPAATPATETSPVPPSAQPEVRRDYLRILGLTARTIDAWLREGILRPTAARHVYERTVEANRRISQLLEQ